MKLRNETRHLRNKAMVFELDAHSVGEEYVAEVRDALVR